MLGVTAAFCTHVASHVQRVGIVHRFPPIYAKQGAARSVSTARRAHNMCQQGTHSRVLLLGPTLLLGGLGRWGLGRVFTQDL